jgi:hypothetical protein
MLYEAGFDPSWTIFDENSIPIASQSLLLERQQLGSNASIEDERQSAACVDSTILRGICVVEARLLKLMGSGLIINSMRMRGHRLF